MDLLPSRPEFNAMTEASVEQCLLTAFEQIRARLFGFLKVTAFQRTQCDTWPNEKAESTSRTVIKHANNRGYDKNFMPKPVIATKFDWRAEKDL